MNPSSTKPKITVGVDIGSTKIGAAFLITDSDSNRPLRRTLLFSGADQLRKVSDELPAIAARSEHGWEFGERANVIDNSVVFRDVKRSITRMSPDSVATLQAGFDQIYQRWGVYENTTDLYRELFRYILDTVERTVLEDEECEKRLGGWTFADIEKECLVTYPVQHSNSLRLSFVGGAHGAGFGMVGTLTEPFAAGHSVVNSRKITERPATLVVLDCGGLSCDAAALHITQDDSAGSERIVQICPPTGILQGGQSINDNAVKWLKSQQAILNLPYNPDWDSVSQDFELLKKTFARGDESLVLKVVGCRVPIPIPPTVMLGFFNPLIKAVVDLALEQYSRAIEAGYMPGYLVLCGGPCWNTFFTKQIFDNFATRLEEDHHQEAVPLAITETTTITEGALLAAENPLLDPYVADSHIGLMYREDWTPGGKPMKRDMTNPALAWIIKAAITLYKTVFRKGGPSNRVIRTEVYQATDGFKPEWMERKKDWNDLRCDITYPLTSKIKANIRLLGAVEAEIPMEKLFPSGREGATAVDAYFEFSATVAPLTGQLLDFNVHYVRDEERHRIKEQFIAAACFKEPSETQCADPLLGPDTYEPLSGTGKRPALQTLSKQSRNPKKLIHRPLPSVEVVTANGPQENTMSIAAALCKEPPFVFDESDISPAAIRALSDATLTVGDIPGFFPDGLQSKQGSTLPIG
ncbi:hypothetical protein EYZ11_012453 [Aspergillus tanneri]|uniref:Uncharacterized protein n=1 Tax=Aspergillus tanneri TaxID=1220188 RepID=A0A4S3J077_9EURO|nr:hypothetical protein EYZ11_012453 [Aspergillus tanneri]